MCESTAYWHTEAGDERIMDSVVFVLLANGEILLEDILGERIQVRGEIEEIKLLEHKILLRQQQ